MRELRRKADRTAYSKYFTYYPDKLAAIRELRKDTHMSLVQAKTIIDQLFSGDEALARRRDAGYYLELYRPDRAKAVRALRQELGFSAAEAQELVDAAYAGEPVPQASGKKAAKAVGKALGITAAFAGITAFKTVKGLVKKKYK